MLLSSQEINAKDCRHSLPITQKKRLSLEKLRVTLRMGEEEKVVWSEFDCTLSAYT